MAREYARDARGAGAAPVDREISIPWHEAKCHGVPHSEMLELRFGIGDDESSEGTPLHPTVVDPQDRSSRKSQTRLAAPAVTHGDQGALAHFVELVRRRPPPPGFFA